ncbi:uncharacterized protein YbaP (TraB family) [Dysgonomonas sp. PH5-45]|uniref:TraB/GumN family protein n=1 Tax=unclassified Dysgonomonas TaxID=2630389 RepID=UPI00247410C3|nr:MULTISPECIES: TraB/GumN family protein [unclassified Dysgonomonas]MDH6355582.1 uncharacterized protein YbaP (TraB family) [Dysgonomonas sp. PH5-45]MDH6388508.1 uncharacterized protein YbaP (TraB family) [Dysgonomonas sp. PH5-37]
MKKTRASILVLALMVCLSVQLCAGQEFTGALLWRISGNGLSRPSYIMGTHHFAPIGSLNRIAGLQDALAESEQVVGELLESDMENLKDQFVDKIVLPAGYSYRTMLTEEEYNLLDEYLTTKVGLGMEQMSLMKPAFIAIMCAEQMNMAANPEFDLSVHEDMDTYFQQIAIRDGKSVVALETVDEQMHVLFENGSYQEQAKSLVCTIQNLDYSISMIKEMDAYYEAGNLTALFGLIDDPHDPCPMSREEKNMLNKDRNRKWLQKLPRIMAHKPSFIAVGCLHLAGKDGLLYNLHKQGYLVEPVK